MLHGDFQPELATCALSIVRPFYQTTNALQGPGSVKAGFKQVGAGLERLHVLHGDFQPELATCAQHSLH